MAGLAAGVSKLVMTLVSTWASFLVTSLYDDSRFYDQSSSGRGLQYFESGSGGGGEVSALATVVCSACHCIYVQPPSRFTNIFGTGVLVIRQPATRIAAPTVSPLGALLVVKVECENVRTRSIGSETDDALCWGRH
eukprot:COSAG01_NODE_2889_length_6907_cov_43.104877_2_plen_136_part_00